MNSSTELLKDQLVLMERSRLKLEESAAQCQKITLKVGLDAQQEIAFEALTARFSRLSDYLVQRVFRTLDVIELDDSGSVRDRINRAEKKDWIDSADDFIKIRTMRNIIAHEYSDAEVIEIYKSVMVLMPALFDACERVRRYVDSMDIKP